MLQQYYQEKSIPVLQKELGIKNRIVLPFLKKIIVTIGLSDARFDKEETDERVKTLKTITGQKPRFLKAKKAISNFKVREGQVIAYMVTLRGRRMFDFADKLINVVLPRIREFRGIPHYSIDNNGNINLGIKEQIAFPEIKIEEVKKMHGLGITLVTTAKNKDEAAALLRSLGAVLSKEKKKKEEEDKLETIAETRKKTETEHKENIKIIKPQEEVEKEE